ncbi:MAG: S-layer protein [Methanomicrobiales archaeon]|nr:S-layer protein [Methanomicrobiales archaeon]MDD1668283.1 S-layer protein [Methanomicrobiales archaeon]
MDARTLLSLVVIFSLLAVPAMAGEKQLFGSPKLSAAISGTNEFTPGQDVTLTVKVQNTGVTDVTIVQSSIITSQDKPNTAKLLVVGLLPGTAPVTVKTDPQMVGDLAGGSSVSASFSVKISKYAAGGVYSLPLQLKYQYLNTADQVSPDTVRFWYYDENITIPLDIRIKPGVTLDVKDARAEQLNVGTEGYVIVRLGNAGSEAARSAVVKLARNGQSPLIPTDASVYIGDFPPGVEKEIRFKASVSGDAGAQDYPVDLRVDYTDYEGDSASSDTVTIGVPVGSKISFAVVSPVSQVNPGERMPLEVVYRNTGSATVYHAEARISAVDPFTSNDDTAYLGDLAPGETGTARFEMTVDSGATPKSYGLDSEIRYRDALDNSQISDTIKVRVDVAQPAGILGTLSNPIVLSVIIALVVIALYYILVHRKKK